MRQQRRRGQLAQPRSAWTVDHSFRTDRAFGCSKTYLICRCNSLFRLVLHRVLERSNRCGLVDLRRVFINLRRSCNVFLLLGLEEMTNTRRQTTSHFNRLRGGLLGKTNQPTRKRRQICVLTFFSSSSTFSSFATGASLVVDGSAATVSAAGSLSMASSS